MVQREMIEGAKLWRSSRDLVHSYVIAMIVIHYIHELILKIMLYRLLRLRSIFHKTRNKTCYIFCELCFVRRKHRPDIEPVLRTLPGMYSSTRDIRNFFSSGLRVLLHRVDKFFRIYVISIPNT
jgi:hypothetical protein